MPLEIKELHIRVTVNQPQEAAEGSAGSESALTSAEAKDGLIRQCVEQVLEILDKKKER